MRNFRFVLACSCLALVGTSLPTQCSAAIVALFDFNMSGNTEGWDGRFLDPLAPVATGGFLQGTALPDDGLSGSPNDNDIDPGLVFGSSLGLIRSTASGVTWTTVEVVAREIDGVTGDVVLIDSDGTVLNANTQLGSGLDDFGPAVVSAPDGNGFQTLTWDISSLATVTTGGIRLDPIGGAGTQGNTFQIDSIVVRDSVAAVPEPSTFTMLGIALAGVAIRRRRIAKPGS